MRMPDTGVRISLPPSVTSMTWSASSTGKDATMRPVLLGERHRDDAFAAAAGGAVLVGRRALAETALGHREHELLGRRQFDIALLAQLDRADCLLGVSAARLLLAVGRAARRWRA